MKINKELQEQIESLIKIKADLIEEDERIRGEFAKSFKWYEEKQTYWYSQSDSELRDPSWEEIFVKVGRILSTRFIPNCPMSKDENDG